MGPSGPALNSMHGKEKKEEKKSEIEKSPTLKS
jgi:hypothetical protein